MDKDKQKAIADRLEKIARLNGGRLTPNAVLKDAESTKSPLHDQFEWDNDKAAIQFRLQQARELIRSVQVFIETDSKIVSTVRYIRDPSAGPEQGYVEVAKLKGEHDLARDALLTELRSAQSRFDRAQSLADALGLSNEFQGLRSNVEALSHQVEEAPVPLAVAR